MLTELKAIKSTRKQLRQFAWVMTVAGGVIGGYLYWKGRPLYPWFWGGGGFFLLSGLLFPAVLLPLQKVWMGFAVIMGWIMTRVVLTILFYLVVTPLGLAARLSGKDFLHRALDKNAATYWKPYPHRPLDVKRYRDQF